MTVKYCLKKGFVQVLLLWFLSWHPTPCLSCARVPDPSQWRCLGDGEWWECTSPGSRDLDERGRQRDREEQSWRWHLPLGTKKWKDPLCFRAAYLLGHTIGLSLSCPIGVAPKLPLQGLYAHFRPNRSVRFPVFWVERKGACRQGFSVCVVALAILGSVSAGRPIIVMAPLSWKDLQGHFRNVK